MLGIVTPPGPRWPVAGAAAGAGAPDTGDASGRLALADIGDRAVRSHLERAAGRMDHVVGDAVLSSGRRGWSAARRRGPSCTC